MYVEEGNTVEALVGVRLSGHHCAAVPAVQIHRVDAVLPRVRPVHPERGVYVVHKVRPECRVLVGMQLFPRVSVQYTRKKRGGNTVKYKPRGFWWEGNSYTGAGLLGHQSTMLYTGERQECRILVGTTRVASLRLGFRPLHPGRIVRYKSSFLLRGQCVPHVLCWNESQGHDVCANHNPPLTALCGVPVRARPISASRCDIFGVKTSH